MALNAIYILSNHFTNHQLLIQRRFQNEKFVLKKSEHFVTIAQPPIGTFPLLCEIVISIWLRFCSKPPITDIVKNVL